MGVAVRPGKILRTLTPSELTSVRKQSAKTRRPALLAAYAATPGRGPFTTDEFTTTTMPRAARSAGKSDAVSKKGALRLVAIAASKLAAEVLSTVAGSWCPALRTNKASLPSAH